MTTHEEVSSDSDEPNDRGDEERDLVDEGVAEAAHTARLIWHIKVPRPSTVKQ